MKKTHLALLPCALLLCSSAAAQDGLTLAEAVKTTLERHPEIRIQHAQVQVQRGLAVQAATPFDTIVGSSLSHTHTETPVAQSQRLGQEDVQITDSTSLGVSSVTGTRWGMTLSPAVTIERLRQRFDPSVPGLPTAPLHRASVGVQLTQSLLRGAGSTRAAGEEIAAKRAAEAAEADVRFVGTARALDTVLAYYQLATARRQVALLEASVAQAQKLVEDTTALVRADQRPAADLRQVEGNLADRQRQLTQAHASAFEAQRLLALSMGLSPEEMDAVPGLANELPVKPADVAQVLATNDLATAFEQRKDLSSAQQIESATRVRKDAAAGNRLPALDLSVGAFYSGLSDEGGEGGYFGSLVHSPAGPNLNASLSLELPVLNKQRQGGYQARAAEHEIADLAVLEQRRQIAARVGIARNNLERAVQALDVADRAAELYLQALDDEREKLRAGLATVIDVVFVQDRLLQIQLNQLNAHLRYAAALAQYRFELGDLPETPQDADERRLAPVLGPSS